MSQQFLLIISICIVVLSRKQTTPRQKYTHTSMLPRHPIIELTCSVVQRNKMVVGRKRRSFHLSTTDFNIYFLFLKALSHRISKSQWTHEVSAPNFENKELMGSNSTTITWGTKTIYHTAFRLSIGCY